MEVLSPYVMEPVLGLTATRANALQGPDFPSWSVRFEAFRAGIDPNVPECSIRSLCGHRPERHRAAGQATGIGVRFYSGFLVSDGMVMPAEGQIKCGSGSAFFYSGGWPW